MGQLGGGQDRGVCASEAQVIGRQLLSLLTCSGSAPRSWRLVVGKENENKTQ